MIHCGDGDLVDRVIVAGRTLVEAGRLKDWDEAELLRDVRKSTDEAWRNFAAYYPFNETIDEAFPAAFKPWSE